MYESLLILIGIKSFAARLLKLHPRSPEDLFSLSLLSVPRSLTAMSVILDWVGASSSNQIPH